MAFDWGKIAAFLREAGSRFRIRRDTGPIETVEDLSKFVRTRSAYVTQKKLYGYLKTRMGTRYPSMFEDEVFAQSINIAKMHVFAASLADLTVYCVTRVATAGHLPAVQATGLARFCYHAGIAENADQIPSHEAMHEWHRTFDERLTATDWKNMAAGGDSFFQSPKALVRWAPIDKKLKQYDREIVENSIRFAFAEVTRDFRKRVAGKEITADWLHIDAENNR